MKTIYTLVSIVAACTLLSAQKAPDFTITDYNNKVHKLYDDYLDNDKVVVLKIMFVTCPPCNIAAPQVQDLYEFFGEGMEDVEFFDLSNKSWDTNASLEGYADKHSLTFPGAGVDGGALTAVDPYVSGEFGRFRGTPTFVVIDRDGNVNFDVSLSLLKAAIEDALDDTGGCSNAFSGEITGADSAIDVSLKSDVVGATVYRLNPDGHPEYSYECQFTFPPQALEYFIEVNKDGEDLIGVSTKDIVFIVRHLLGTDIFESTEEKIAADFTANDVVSARDISEMRKLILGVNAENKDHNSWRFWSTDSDFSNDTTGVLIPDLIERVPLMDVVDSISSGDFAGVKLGDVSGDINPFFGPPTTTRSDLVLRFDDQWVEAGEMVDIEFVYEDNLTISGIQLTMEINAPHKAIICDPALEFHSRGSKTFMNAMAYTAFDVHVDKLEPVFTLQFKAERSGLASEMFALKSNPTPALILLGNNDELSFRIESNPLELGSIVWPNPAHNSLQVSSEENIQAVNLYGNNGQMILQKTSQIDSKVIELDLSDIPSGIYYCRIKTENGEEVQRVIKH